MSLRPVLVVSYYFPPHGGAGTQRFAKFAKYLPEFGYRAVVVTADDRRAPASALALDSSLSEEIGHETCVARVPQDMLGRPTIAERFGRATRFQIDAEQWARHATLTAVTAGREHGVAAVIVSCSPYAAWAIGPAVRKTLGVPFVLDLRDPWALEGWRTYPTAAHAVWDRSRMIKALRSADGVIANTPAAREALVRVAGLDVARVTTIPNGFDSDDFVGATPPPDGRFRVVHVGTLHHVEPSSRRGVRGLLQARGREIDERGRSGRYLYEALGLLKRDAPHVFARITIELIGQVHPSHRTLARTLGVESAIVERGYLPHRQATAAMQHADLLFVPLHAIEDGEPELIVPGKLYECLASERPVLACVPDGDAARLVRASEGGVVCRPNDSSAIAARLRAAVESADAGRAWRGVDRARLAAFERRALTERLADVLDGLCLPARISANRDPWECLEADALLPVVEVKRHSRASTNEMSGSAV